MRRKIRTEVMLRMNVLSVQGREGSLFKTISVVSDDPKIDFLMEEENHSLWSLVERRNADYDMDITLTPNPNWRREAGYGMVIFEFKAHEPPEKCPALDGHLWHVRLRIDGGVERLGLGLGLELVLGLGLELDGGIERPYNPIASPLI